jgi:hypothetical protein
MVYEDGAIANHVYTNECLGISFAIPEGWQAQDVVGSDVRGQHSIYGDVILVSLRPENKHRALHILLRAQFAIPSDKSAESFVLERIDLDKALVRDSSFSLVHEPSEVQYGDHFFVRADLKSTPERMMDVLIPSFDAFVFTKFRDFFIGANVIAPTEQGLDATVQLLRGLSFQEKEQNLTCEMRGGTSHR